MACPARRPLPCPALPCPSAANPAPSSLSPSTPACPPGSPGRIGKTRSRFRSSAESHNTRNLGKKYPLVPSTHNPPRPQHHPPSPSPLLCALPCRYEVTTNVRIPTSPSLASLHVACLALPSLGPSSPLASPFLRKNRLRGQPRCTTHPQHPLFSRSTKNCASCAC